MTDKLSMSKFMDTSNTEPKPGDIWRDSHPDFSYYRHVDILEVTPEYIYAKRLVKVRLSRKTWESTYGGAARFALIKKGRNS